MAIYEACRLTTTRRWHIYDIDESHSVCGSADSNVSQVLELGDESLVVDIVSDWPEDDLNYCERCSRVLRSRYNLPPATINVHPPSVQRHYHNVKELLNEGS